MIVFAFEKNKIETYNLCLYVCEKHVCVISNNIYVQNLCNMTHLYCSHRETIFFSIFFPCFCLHIKMCYNYHDNYQIRTKSFKNCVRGTEIDLMIFLLDLILKMADLLSIHLINFLEVQGKIFVSSESIFNFLLIWNRQLHRY